MKHSLSLWLPSYEAVRNNKPEVDGADGANFDPVEVSPLLYTTRIAAVKMLIDLEEWDLSIQVGVSITRYETVKLVKVHIPSQILDGLLEEDDEVVETWYLLGWVNRLRATLVKRTFQVF